MEQEYNKINFEYQGERVAVQYEFSSAGTFHIRMLSPYKIETEYNGAEIDEVISQGDGLENAVEKKAIELYDLIRKTERNTVTLSQIHDLLKYYKSNLTAEDENDAVNKINKRLNMMLECYLASDDEHADCKWFDKITPSLLPKLLEVELDENLKNRKKPETITVEYKDEKALSYRHPSTIKGSLTFYRNGDECGFSMKMTEPFEVELPEILDDDLSRYRTKAHVEELAEEKFKHLAMVLNYFFSRRQICEALYTRTDQLDYALTYIKYEGGFSRDLIDNFDEFMEFSFDRYFHLEVENFIEDAAVNSILHYMGVHFFNRLFYVFLLQGYPR